MRVLLATLALVIATYAFMPSRDIVGLQAYAPGDMPPNLAAYELAEEPDYAKAKLATMRVQMPHGTCSGTAIDHHKVMTAKHCIERGTDGLIIGGRTVVVTNVEEDKYDAVILTTDLYFTHIAKFGPRPKQGHVVFSHGNPSSTPDILLVGRVAGWVHSYFGIPDVMLLDRNDWYGCSGAAVFDTDGRIVGIVNALFPWPNDGWRLTAVYPLTFTKEQLTPEPAA